MTNLKIYIEPASLPITNQLADYARCYDEPGTVKIIIFERLALDAQALQQHNTLFSMGINANLPQRMETIGGFINEINPSSIEIHSNLFRSGEIILLLLKKLSATGHLPRVNLHLWDDGLTGIMERLKFSEQEGDTLLRKYHTMAGMLLDTLSSQVDSIKPERGNSYLNYLWSTVVSTTWHLLCPELIPDIFHQVFKDVKHCSKPMTFDFKERLSSAQFEFFKRLLNIPESLIEKLTLLRDQPQALLFLGTFRFPRCFSDLHHEALIKKIAQLRQEGKLPPPELIVFKGHPEDKLYNDRLLKALGENVTQIPDSIPVEFLEALNLLPGHIGGSFGVSFMTLVNKAISFVLMNENQAYQQTKEYLELLKRTNRVQENQVYFLEESVKLNKKRIIHSDASLGDLLFALGAIKALKAQDPAPVTIVVNDMFQGVARRSPWVDEVLCIDQLTTSQKQEIAVATEWGVGYGLSEWQNVIAPMHMTDAFLQALNIDNAQAIHKNIELTVKKSDQRKVDKFIAHHRLSRHNTLLLHANNGAPNRTWSEQQWNDLAAMLMDAGWRVVVIGHNTNKNSHTMFTITTAGVVDAVGLFSVMETVYLMKKSRLLVACDSGPVAMAGATDIAICALYSQINSQYRLPYRQGEVGWNALGIDLECQYASCGQYIQDIDFYHATLNSPMPIIDSQSFANWCPAQEKYHCLKNLSAQSVFEKITGFIQFG